MRAGVGTSFAVGHCHPSSAPGPFPVPLVRVTEGRAARREGCYSDEEGGE